ncbi:hypothetical protein QBC34DRAFT_479340 [Podospora aff. communis PSN243]|uniref:chitinase n=1 Tax=Podospora aff. communis PSN243 TaxID=3040156 RepID=A0AAV9G5X4_9PEZI|nr:hypothetical protein QBC34DRAFT_479340 [Podospora aff. communis PSN243]
MKLSRFVSFFSFLCAVEALPGHGHGHGHSHLHRRQHLSTTLSKDICLPIPALLETQEDLVAKLRSDTCGPDEHLVSVPLSSPSPPSGLLARQAEDPYACSETKECGNHACCGKSGHCGYGPLYCGTNGQSPNDVCWSNCDAKASCGRFAEPVGKKCPLNVCCSQHGFCGTTEEFCAVTEDPLTSCQNGCEQPSSGSAGGGNVQKRIIGYYEAWNTEKKCIGMNIDQIPAESLTHLYYSFGYVEPNTFKIVPMRDDDGSSFPAERFRDVNRLKERNPKLKIVIALGGWTHNDNHTIWQPVFSDSVSSQSNRAKFIREIKGFLDEYGYDGVDMDWEYPGAPDRGGGPEDGVNFTKFLQELRIELDKMPGGHKEISFTAPTSYWYLQHFDLEATAEAVDFVNVMSYDLHGVWDRNSSIGAQVLAHTNLTEIDLALKLMWRNNVDPAKISLGIGFYGRSFQLQDPSCHQPGCPFRGAASPGECTGNPGTLSYREIQDIIERENLTPYHDEVNAVKYITWGGDQWVSYDDKDTIQQKITFANGLGLGGLLIWAIDLDTADLDALQAVLYPKPLGTMTGGSVDKWQDAGSGMCRVSKCGDPNCRPGEVRVTHQQCSNGGSQEALCCPMSSAPDPSTCTWRGGDNTWTGDLWCGGQCHEGEVSMMLSKWGDRTSKCSDGHKVYCCPAVAELPDCRWTKCYDGGCNEDEEELTWKKGSCSRMASPRLKFCCKKEQKWDKNKCEWRGKPGNCFDNQCRWTDGFWVAMTVQSEGEGKDCGVHKPTRKRTFCCQPGDDKSPFLPVPLANLFPEPPTNAETEFKLKLDKTYGGAVPKGVVGDQNDSNDAPFGFVVLTSPDEIQIPLNRRDGSHWEVFDCFDNVSEEEQTVRMVCADTSEASNCGKIHLGHGAVGTIVEMPDGCGPGRYAVVKAMELSSNQQLPDHLTKRGIETGEHAPIYDLTFDYDFRRVPRDLGDTQMRIDFSNEPEYWDNIVAKAAQTKKKRKRSLDDFSGSGTHKHKRWLEEEWRDDAHFGGVSADELHKRWFGSTIIEWLQEMMGSVVPEPELSHAYEDKFIVKLVDERLTCPNMAAKLEIRAETDVKVETNFGFTLIATLSNGLVPDLSNSYLYFRNQGEVKARFMLDGHVTMRYDTNDILLLSADRFGAAFRVPGLVTVGPNFKLFGRLEAEATLGVQLDSRVVLARWDTQQTFPAANVDYHPKEKAKPSGDGTANLLEPTFEYGLQLEGFVSAHIKPTITFGIEFNRNIINVEPATVNLVADGYLRFHAEFDTGSGGTSFCYGVDAGAEIYATIDVPQALAWTLPQTHFGISTLGPVQVYPSGSSPACWSPASSRAVRGLAGLDGPVYDEVWANETVTRRHSDLGLLERATDLEPVLLNKRAQVYGPLMPRMSGLRCPGPTNFGDNPHCELCETPPSQNTKRDEELCIIEHGRPGEPVCPLESPSRRAARHRPLAGRAIEQRAIKTKYVSWDYRNARHDLDCAMYPSCGDAKDNPHVTKWFGWSSSNNVPTSGCQLDIEKLNINQVTVSEYQSDHIYEAQLLRDFFLWLANPANFPTGYGSTPGARTTHDWVSQVLLDVDSGVPAFPVTISWRRPYTVRTDTFFAAAQGLGSIDNPEGLALLHRAINNKKKSIFAEEWLDRGDPNPRTGDLNSRRMHRNTYAVFSYINHASIWPKFRDSSRDIEQALHAFDTTYPYWQPNPPANPPAGMITLPARLPGQPRAGLRDLYCYWFDRKLQSIEANAQIWFTAAQQEYRNNHGSSTAAASWLHATTGKMRTGGPIYNGLKFNRQPGARHGATGLWAHSWYEGLWLLGPAGPF